jgi:acyl-CoA carboxylase subunit beta
MKTIPRLLRRSDSGETVQVEPPHETCLSCGADLEGSRSYLRFRVCHSCGFHFHLRAQERVATLLDPGTFRETDRGVTSIDPLSFAGRRPYRGRVINAQRRTGLAEAALTGTGTVFGRDVVIAVLDFSFLGGSIGVVAGERLARAFEKAAARRTPVITVLSTSGTRMQEGVLALMQIPRVATAALRHSRLGLPHVAVLTDPTTGSAYTGFVNLADYTIAEPNALVGYAALRVLEEREGHELPAGSHTSESLLEHGLIDAVMPRADLRDAIALLLDLLMSDYRLSATSDARGTHISHTQKVALQQLELSRHQERPTATDLVGRMTSGFTPLHGDRMGTDDPAILAGFASLGGEAVAVIGQVRRPGPQGWISPGGFRKATRAMRLAAKFRLPVITLIDTAGADPSLESEQDGLGAAMADCLATLIDLPVPTIAVITGEGNSEAAVTMAAADRVLMLDNAVYEVIRPEDAARQLYQDTAHAGEVADRLRMTSHDCIRLNIVDATVPEPGDGAHTDHQEAALLLRRSILRELTRVQGQKPKRRLERRYDRYRHMGSTRARMRGTIERRLAHVWDRIGGIWDRLRGRSTELRRKGEYGDTPNIPV